MDLLVFQHWNINIANQTDLVFCLLINAAVAYKSIGRVKLDNRRIQRDDYSILINCQAKLGWKQVLYGRFSLAWEEHQWEYDEEMAIRRNTFNPWLKQIICTLWQELYIQWKARSTTIHSNITKDSYYI
eukprot:15355230-Ditylum_brightwellii.AAC.1